MGTARTSHTDLCGEQHHFQSDKDEVWELQGHPSSLICGQRQACYHRSLERCGQGCQLAEGSLPGKQVKRGGVSLPGKEVKRGGVSLPGKQVKRGGVSLPGKQVKRGGVSRTVPCSSSQ